MKCHGLLLGIFSATTLLAQSTTTPTMMMTPDTNVIRQIQTYNLNFFLQNEIEGVQRSLNDRTYGEFHIGFGTRINPGFDPQFIGVFALKISPIHPKLPVAKNVSAKLFKICRLAGILGDTLTKENRQAIIEAEQKMAAYERDKWRRPSLLLSFPFRFFESDTAYAYNTTIVSRVITRLDPQFIPTAALSLGYDLGDYATVSAGVTIEDHPRAILTLNLDLSTPAYSSIVSFLNSVRIFFNSRSTATYYPVSPY